jgi:flagellar protein FlaF
LKSGYSAYSRNASAGLTGRRLEGQAFAKAAALLGRAAEAPGDRALLAEALKVNNRLWAIVEAEVAAPRSPLPDDLRGQLLSLGRFMDKETLALLSRGHDRLVLEAMAEVNRSLASGLLG